MVALSFVALISAIAAHGVPSAINTSLVHRTETCAAVVRPGKVLAHPVVTGAAGPFARTILILERPAEDAQAAFTGRLATPEGCFDLAGPDDPAAIYLFDVRAVSFTPLDRSATRGVVILANRSQIGPGHGTERIALVYRVTAHGATRVPALETRLEGARDAAAVRRVLKAR